MKIDARGMKHPMPLEEIRAQMRKLCKQPVDIELLVDSSEYSKTISTFARMSKCKTKIDRADGYYIIRISGDSCTCN